MPRGREKHADLARIAVAITVGYFVWGLFPPTASSSPAKIFGLTKGSRYAFALASPVPGNFDTWWAAVRDALSRSQASNVQVEKTPSGALVRFEKVSPATTTVSTNTVLYPSEPSLSNARLLSVTPLEVTS